MEKSRKTFRMCDVPCKEVAIRSDSTGTLVDMEGIPIDKLDEMLEDVSSQDIVNWLLEMDIADFAYFWDKLQVRAKEMKEDEE